ncbi:hypothetical protein Esti_005326 [Eimeria stiedai]
MTTLLKAFRDCVERMRFHGVAHPPSVPIRFACETREGSSSLGVTAIKADDPGISLINSHACKLAQENPAALARLIAYLREVHRVNELLHQHGVGSPSKPLKDLQKTAELVGLRLPVVSSKEHSPQEQNEDLLLSQRSLESLFSGKCSELISTSTKIS